MTGWKKVSAALALSIVFMGTGFNVNVVQAKPTMQQQVSLSATKRDLAKAEEFALLWMKSSAEYKALCYQGYNLATLNIDRAIANHKEGTKPLAIILDCDETVVANAPGLNHSALENNGYYDSPWWRAWCKEGKSVAMPGAVEFLKSVDKKGIGIFYVTGRGAKYSQKETTENLKKIGFPQINEEHLLMYTDNPNKEPRFDKVAEKYDVILYMGDNIGDFPLGLTGKDRATRHKTVEAAQKDFGTKYIMFPNPVYGSWTRAMDKAFLYMTPQERAEVTQRILAE